MTRLRENIGKRVLNRKRKGIQRQVHVHNFKTARSAVILFDTGQPDSFQAIKDFRWFLETHGINCTAFGYVRQKEIPQEMLFWENYSFITRSDLNWYLKPTGEATELFFAQDPDILVDFIMDPILEMQYLVQLSGASFKIGSFTEQENDYDLMINLPEHSEIGYLAEQIKHYVNMLNPSN